MTLLEVCVDSIESLCRAQDGGADRIELCSRLDRGGLSPHLGAVDKALKVARIPVHVMVRPHRERDIVELRRRGVPGVVFGILRADRTIDRDAMARLIERARPMSVTFHRAFDESVDSLETLIELGVDRVLTSGRRPSAIEGQNVLAEWVKQAGTRIIVMAGGGVRAHNVDALIRATGVREVQSSTWFRLPGGS
jgi:copper homeostasis protein